MAYRASSYVAHFLRRASAPLAIAAFVAACSTPNANTAAGQSEIAGQKCQLCIIENPGDGSPCYSICMQRQEDQTAYAKAYRH